MKKERCLIIRRGTFRRPAIRSLVVVASFLIAVGVAVGLGNPVLVLADEDQLNAVPFTFVGKAADCTPSPAGSRIVTARWLGGMGLPDNGGPNTTANKDDRHTGLLLSKNGLTADCSSAGARIEGGVNGMPVTANFTLGFDVRNGTHCGGGAPRFNVTVKTGATEMFSFVGNCSLATATPAPQDPVEWTRLRWDATSPSQAFPPIPVGSTVKSITLIYDEGTDTTGTQDPNGVGLSVVDNIFINGVLITREGAGD